MARSTVIRPLADGSGCSACSSLPQNVGKRRCRHVLDSADITIRTEKGVNFIDLNGKSGDDEVSFSLPATKSKVKNYITSLSNALDDNEKEAILNVIRGM